MSNRPVVKFRAAGRTSSPQAQHSRCTRRWRGRQGGFGSSNVWFLLGRISLLLPPLLLLLLPPPLLTPLLPLLFLLLLARGRFSGPRTRYSGRWGNGSGVLRAHG